MQDRNQTILALRPNIDTITDSLNTKDIESFQNKVLRPILKFQNHLLLHLFAHYARQANYQYVYTATSRPIGAPWILVFRFYLSSYTLCINQRHLVQHFAL